MLLTEQFILELDLPFLPKLADLTVGQNSEVFNAAYLWCNLDSASLHSVLTWGGVGAGKTVLAQALAQETGGVLLCPDSSSQAFEQAFQAHHVIFDDLDQFNSVKADAAFDIFNYQIQQQQGRWWATSSVPTQAMANIRPDLSSRTAWGLVYQLHALSDLDCKIALQSHAHSLGFELNDDCADYLIVRLERNLGSLTKHLASLNQYALALKKPVNSHLVQQWYKQIYTPQSNPNSS